MGSLPGDAQERRLTAECGWAARPSKSERSVPGMIQSYVGLGITLRTRHGDHANPKRKRRSGLPSLALRFSLPGCNPELNHVQSGGFKSSRRADSRAQSVSPDRAPEHRSDHFLSSLAMTPLGSLLTSGSHPLQQM